MIRCTELLVTEEGEQLVDVLEFVDVCSLVEYPFFEELMMQGQMCAEPLEWQTQLGEPIDPVVLAEWRELTLDKQGVLYEWSVGNDICWWLWEIDPEHLPELFRMPDTLNIESTQHQVNCENLRLVARTIAGASPST